MLGIFTTTKVENGYYEQATKLSKTALTVVTSLGTVKYHVRLLLDEFAKVSSSAVMQSTATAKMNGTKTVWW